MDQDRLRAEIERLIEEEIEGLTRARIDRNPAAEAFHDGGIEMLSTVKALLTRSAQKPEQTDGDFRRRVEDAILELKSGRVKVPGSSAQEGAINVLEALLDESTVETPEDAEDESEQEQ